MADAQEALRDPGQKDKKHRSPAYPFISLSKAIERAREFYEQERRHSAPLTAAAQHWGYREKSSGGLQTISALKQFGLMADDGSGADRRVKLTDRAFRILLDEVAESAERAAALKEAALDPTLYADMFEKWGVDLPSDETIRTYLRRDRGFNDEVLGQVIKSYKETLSFSRVTKSDSQSPLFRPDQRLDQRQPPSVGDYVQWESAGAWQFAEPKKFVGISDDGEFGFVEGEATGVPVEQLIKADPPVTERVAPPMPAHLATALSSSKPPAGAAREVSSLPEGEAVLQWPANLSLESVEELEAWLGLVIKKMKRRYAEAK